MLLLSRHADHYRLRRRKRRSCRRHVSITMMLAMTMFASLIAAATTATSCDAATPASSNQQQQTLAPSSKSTKKRLTLDTMSQSLRKMEYAVRGDVVVQADKISDELKLSPNKYPVFDHIVYTNIGNPQSVGQIPLTWPRQVLALCDLPRQNGIDHPDVHKIFPQDAIDRAREILDACHTTGAYSHSQGVYQLRQDVANFISARDNGVPCDPNHLFLTNGASAGIQMVLQALLASPNDGVLLPIPQYPIYSATIDLLNGHKVGYYLNEDNDWALNMQELERSLEYAKSEGINVNCLVLITPGNPTGQVLSAENVREIVQFCIDHNLVLLADEVYQENVYDGEFYSCKKAAADLHALDKVELVSFHSVSKGVFGECGRRGGYMELTGIDPQVQEQLYKLASSSLCSCITGQIMVSLMVRGPKPGNVSYESHEREKREIYESLKRRAKIVSGGLNDIPGFSCCPAAGSMYCFPKVEMPEKAISAAQQQNMSVDNLYCLSLLKKTGICVVPASGFGQKSGRHGFRTTFLPSETEMARCVQLIQDHYTEFLNEYS